MEKEELIKAVEEGGSAIEFFKLKDEIVQALGKTSLAKKIAGLNSAIDLYDARADILYELTQGEKELPKKKRGGE